MTLETELAPVVAALRKQKKAVFFLGAGVLTSCGIPDFRSPKTGLYANLKRLNLPYPEAVFDIDYFRDSPKAFYTLCDELYPGNFLPSRFHYLLRLFQQKHLLKRVYTQNIDTLESLAGVDDEYIVAAHGSFADNHCIDCNHPMSTEELKTHMANKHVNDGIPCCAKCKGYVKPDIVFFGEGLPRRFFDLWDEDSDDVDVAIVAGTSLTVYPFAGLPSECGKKALRVLVNKEVVGDFSSNKRKTDIILQHDCDHVANVLAKMLGWEKELDELVALEAQKFAATKIDAEDRAKAVAEAIKEAEEAEVKAEEKSKQEEAKDEKKAKGAKQEVEDAKGKDDADAELEARLAKLSV